MSKTTRKAKKSWSVRTIVVFGVTIYLLFSFAHLGYALHQANLRIKAYEDQKRALLAERARLQEQIRQLNEDSYIERLAREELGLIKPGEKVIIPAVPGQVRPYIPPKPGYQFGD